MLKTIYNKLISAGYASDFAKIVCLQALHESDYFKSDLFRRAANAFGMRVPGRRSFTRSGVTNNYSAYNSLSQCVDDYIYYLKDQRITPSNGSIKMNNILSAASASLKSGAEYYAELLKSQAYYGDSETNYKKGMVSAIPYLIKILK